MSRGEPLLSFFQRLQDQFLDIADRHPNEERKAVWEALAIEQQPMIEACRAESARRAGR
jgi:hypothetical protein